MPGSPGCSSPSTPGISAAWSRCAQAISPAATAWSACPAAPTGSSCQPARHLGLEPARRRRSGRPQHSRQPARHAPGHRLHLGRGVQRLVVPLPSTTYSTTRPTTVSTRNPSAQHSRARNRLHGLKPIAGPLQHPSGLADRAAPDKQIVGVIGRDGEDGDALIRRPRHRCGAATPGWPGPPPLPATPRQARRTSGPRRTRPCPGVVDHDVPGQPVQGEQLQGVGGPPPNSTPPVRREQTRRRAEWIQGISVAGPVTAQRRASVAATAKGSRPGRAPQSKRAHLPILLRARRSATAVAKRQTPRGRATGRESHEVAERPHARRIGNVSAPSGGRESNDGVATQDGTPSGW